MSLSAVINFFVSKRLYKVAIETDSIALEADALHFKTDVYTSLGVAVGLGLISITNLHILDPIIAIAVALIIVYEAIVLIKNAYKPLVDFSLPENDIKLIHSILKKFTHDCISFHQFRTRKSGSHKYLDFHLEVPEEMTVKDAHKLCDDIENDLKLKINNLDINIHIEPCSRKRLPK